MPEYFGLTPESDLSLITDAMRLHHRLTVSFEELPQALVPAYAAFMLGLSSAAATGSAAWMDGKQMTVAWPNPPVAPAVALQHQPERHEIEAFDKALDSVARADQARPSD